ncbi:MAG: hypothetical protein OFPII_24110 [Osedax symbiont Rs1]|nr:MAG: hypothetical protein OFPII_24110 [Osedax symbiont Rs1]
MIYKPITSTNTLFLNFRAGIHSRKKAKYAHNSSYGQQNIIEMLYLI